MSIRRPAGLGPGEGQDDTTVNHNDHVAAAAYLMKHLGVTVLSVLDGQWPGRLIGILTEDNIVEAAAADQDLNDLRVRDLMTDANSREVDGLVPDAAAVLHARSGLPTEARLAACAGQFADSGWPARYDDGAVAMFHGSCGLSIPQTGRPEPTGKEPR